MPLKINDYMRTSYQAPTVQPNMAGADLLKSVSNEASRLADDAVSKWSKAQIANAAAEGEIAGNLPQVTFRDEGTLSAQAFNDAAKASHLAIVRTTAQSTLNSLQDKYEFDPEGYLRESTASIQGIVSGLKESSQTRGAAGQIEAQLRASQEASAYTIARKQQAKMIEETKAVNEDNMFSIKTDTYRNASAIFSKDPTEKAYALNQFATAKNLFDASLHAVLPNGQAVYDAKEIQKMRQDFHTGYYVKALKDYVTSDAATVGDMMSILHGEAKVNIPLEGGKSADIDLLSEVGTEAFDKVQTFVKTKLSEREAERTKRESLEKEMFKDAQKANGFDLSIKIASGVPIPLDQINGMLQRGEIDYTTATVAREMAMKNRSEDNISAVTQINAAIANGDDASAMITANAHLMKPDTLIALSKANENGLNSKFKNINNENLRMFKAEFLKMDAFGSFTDLNMAAVYNDLSMSYNKMIEDGMEPSLAFEKIRAIGEDVKAADAKGKFKRMKDYIQYQDDNTTPDKGKTLLKLKADYKAGIIGGALAKYYLEALNNE